MKDTKYLHYQIDFFVGGSYEYETICESLDDVRDYLQSIDIDFDDEERDAEVRIKGIGMTRDGFKEWQKSKTYTKL